MLRFQSAIRRSLVSGSAIICRVEAAVEDSRQEASAMTKAASTRTNANPSASRFPIESFIVVSSLWPKCLMGLERPRILVPRHRPHHGKTGTSITL
eukprot:m.938809 g.938809  ORF g.938809 m.938809 type:complete len:96 (-) comp237575_c0_seq1:512-799(-)